MRPTWSQIQAVYLQTFPPKRVITVPADDYMPSALLPMRVIVIANIYSTVPDTWSALHKLIQSSIHQLHVVISVVQKCSTEVSSSKPRFKPPQGLTPVYAANHYVIYTYTYTVIYMHIHVCTYIHTYVSQITRNKASNIKKSKMPRNEFNPGCERPVYRKLNGKIFHAHGLEEYC